MFKNGKPDIKSIDIMIFKAFNWSSADNIVSNDWFFLLQKFKVFSLNDWIPKDTLVHFIFLNNSIIFLSIFTGLHSIVYSCIQFVFIDKFIIWFILFKTLAEIPGLPPPI
jgi:hypothetical protein